MASEVVKAGVGIVDGEAVRGVGGEDDIARRRRWAMSAIIGLTEGLFKVLHWWFADAVRYGW